MEVFVAEVAESQRLIGELLAEAGAADRRTGSAGRRSAGPSRPAARPRLGRRSTRRRSSRGGAPAAGTVRNWRAFDDAARARNVFTDMPIIEASFWQTVAGFSR